MIRYVNNKSCVLCAIRTCFVKSTSDVLDNIKMESWYDTTLKMAFKTSFNTLYLRSILQRHSPRIYRIPWRINETKLWIPQSPSKEEVCSYTYSNAKGSDFLLYCSTRHQQRVVSQHEEVCSANDPTATFFKRKLKRGNMLS